MGETDLHRVADLLDILEVDSNRRISAAWDQRDFRTLWSAARAMLSHPCGPKRGRNDIPLSSLPTAAAWATHLRQAGPSGGCFGTKVEWEAQQLEVRSREQQGARWPAAEGYSAEPEEQGSASSTITSSARDSGLGGSRRTLPAGCGPDAG